MNKYEFEFEVLEYFIFSDSQICISGTMHPSDIPYITPDYIVELVTASGKRHQFHLIGEEIFSRSQPRSDNRRVLRTKDNVEPFLKNIKTDPVKIRGVKNK